MNTLIEGLRLDVKAEEMREHARKRASYHREKRAVYEKSIDDINKGIIKAEQVTESIGKGGQASAVDGLEKAAEQHRQRERFFAYAAEHFVEGAIYRLELQALEQFEIAPTGLRSYGY